ncbi:hypothetical protein VTK73DRAFT_7624 [Phialemonium thermophilum]|uniref:Multicopper oxidase n=1 Tax=Phialemonium thermophilum TaxID=223376 RepID=A0ABR3Y6D4_9PEZI
MAGECNYKPVRSSSPLSIHVEPSSYELGPSPQDLDLEQHVGLLAREKSEEQVDACDEQDTISSLEDSSRLTQTRISLVWLLPLGSFIATVLLLSYALRLGQESRRHVGPLEDFRRPASEYILDSTWDFDAPPRIREYDWVIQEIVANPDGVFRPMLTVNGKFPGELIRCNEGDTIVVNVRNEATNATALHWHGLFQNGTNWMDGTPGVTQCPIAPGGRFRYEFKIENQAGTYFYHGHQAAQGLDGLVGPIIIHSRNEREQQEIPYVSDRVVLLQDWYYDPSSALLKQKLSPGSESSPIPNGALLNGANKVDCALHPSRRCDNSSAALTTFDLQPDENHRLRLINTGAFAWFEVTVDRHLDLPVTEIDGVNVEPASDSGLIIGPGQRYSMILPANQTGADLFWFRARMLKHCFSENVLPEHGFDEARAVVRYAPLGSAATREDLALPDTENDSGKATTECKDVAPGRYKPVPALAAPEYAHKSWYLRVNLGIGDWRLERGHLNGSSFRPNLKSPTLHRVVDGLRSSNQSFQLEGLNDRAFDLDTELVLSHNGVEVVDVILQNFDEGNHPFHLHGHQMFILASGHGYFPGYESLGLAPEGKGLLDPSNTSVIDNPLRRDVATVEGFGWLLIRFIADNPGLWLFHCHMVWHGESGMAMQFLSRLDMLKKWAVPEENARLCEASTDDLEKGAPPKDSFWYGSSP